MHVPAVLLLSLLAALAPAWAAAGELPEILVSRPLAEAKGLAVADELRLSLTPDAEAAEDFLIVGIHEPAPDPMSITQSRWGVRMHLPDLLDMRARAGQSTTPDAVDAINVALAEGVDPEDFAARMRTENPFVLVRPTEGASGQVAFFRVLDRFHLAIAAITMLGSTAFLLALMVMRADERRETMGLLRLLGVVRMRIAQAALIEGLVIAIPGALLGVLVALLTQGLVNRFFQWHYDTTLVFLRVTPELALRCVAVAIPLGVLAGLLVVAPLVRRDVIGLQRR